MPQPRVRLGLQAAAPPVAALVPAMMGLAMEAETQAVARTIDHRPCSGILHARNTRLSYMKS